jgi:hypothetical protein
METSEAAGVSIETPESRRHGLSFPSGSGRTRRESSWEEGGWKQPPEVGRCETLERTEPQESNEAATQPKGRAVADGLTRGARPWSRARARARLSVAAATLRRFANIGAIGRRQAEDGPLQWDQIGCAADDTRGAGVERRYGFAGGKSSEGENPTSVTGMKQGRRDQEGANRQEVEKTWRRNVPGQVTPGG